MNDDTLWRILEDDEQPRPRDRRMADTDAADRIVYLREVSPEYFESDAPEPCGLIFAPVVLAAWSGAAVYAVATAIGRKVRGR